MPGICPTCKKNVYFAEEVKGLGNDVYHRSCFTCNSCKKALEPGKVSEHDGNMFCNSCYKFERYLDYELSFNL